MGRKSQLGFEVVKFEMPTGDPRGPAAGSRKSSILGAWLALEEPVVPRRRSPAPENRLEVSLLPSLPTSLKILLH